jgi:hypothetical protein
MKKTVLLIPLLLATCSWAATNPDDYSIDVHVTSSRWFMEPSTIGPRARQKLDVIIDGKKYELEAFAFPGNIEAGVTLLALGDYKAKLIQGQHKTTYEASQTYEFLLPDKKTRKFIVVGLTE